MVPPKSKGRVAMLAPAGNYKILDDLLILDTPEGRQEKLQMIHKWPIREARPTKEKLRGSLLPPRHAIFYIIEFGIA